MCTSKQQKACMECTKKCLRAHGKKPSSPLPPRSTLPSFFKIMIGHFDQAMFIPPKFAQSLGGLVSNNIYLEDSNGNCWSVKISVIDGSLAFEQGWHDFVLDHSITFGEVVIFKHISISLFSIQIYAISGCERVHFHDKISSNSDTRSRKRSKNEISPENSRSNKDHNSFEASKGKHHSVDKDSVKKNWAINAVPCDLSGSKLTVSNYATKGAGRDLKALEEYPHCDNGPGRLSNAPCHIIDGDAMRTEEACRISPINLCDRPISKCTHTKEQTSSTDHPKELYNMVLEDSVCKQEVMKMTQIDSVDSETFKNNSLARCQNVSTAECTNSETTNQVEASWAIITYPMTEEMPTIDYSQGQNIADEDHMRKCGLEQIHTVDTLDCGIIVSKLDDEEIVGTSNSRPQSVTATCAGDDGGNQIALKMVDRKYLVTEEGICYNVDEDLMNNPGTSRDAPIDSFVPERDASVCLPDKVAIFNCTKDDQESFTPSCNGFGNYTQSEGKLGNSPTPVSREEDISWVGTVRSTPPIMTDMSGFHKDSVVMEANSCQPEVDNKPDSPCSKGKVFGVVKTEILDSTDLPSPNYANFSIFASVDSKSWLLLPERLPTCTGKKKLDRRIMVLRDPSMRRWPVLYHESTRFIGFIGGWEDFAKANNLQPGDTCEIEFSNGS